MDFQNLKKNWNYFGEIDPIKAVLTNIEDVKEEFFLTGIADINLTEKELADLGLKMPKGVALDFGCGIGRLTQALCGKFDSVYGVDIANTMVERAKKYNKYGEKCLYITNENEDLSIFEDNKFDFIVTFICLQHMEPVYFKKYIKEFMRILKTDGILVFNLPTCDLIERKYLDYQYVMKANVKTIMSTDNQKIHLTIKNVGRSIWQRADNLNIGNHWWKNFGEVLLYDDKRVKLPKDIVPEESFKIDFVIDNIPAGATGMSIDLVIENKAWFSEFGNKILTFPIEHSESKFPRMEIYGEDFWKVVKLIYECEGVVLSAKYDANVCPPRAAYKYYVKKNS